MDLDLTDKSEILWCDTRDSCLADVCCLWIDFRGYLMCCILIDDEEQVVGDKHVKIQDHIESKNNFTSISRGRGVPLTPTWPTF